MKRVELSQKTKKENLHTRYPTISLRFKLRFQCYFYSLFILEILEFVENKIVGTEQNLPSAIIFSWVNNTSGQVLYNQFFLCNHISHTFYCFVKYISEVIFLLGSICSQ